MKNLTLIGWLPLEFLPLIIFAAGILMVIGARAISISLLIMALMMALLPPILEPFLSMLPLWALLVLGAIVFIISIKDLLSLGKSKKQREKGKEQFRKTIGSFMFMLLGFFVILVLINDRY